ncbi:acyl transferase/acyl hydrolase/lysophospholipase [Flagelloscypha sp. PMI_526]|nr:acyl transferase/acyl hydrolase/lysophospholipase [Flagelloscypha sp. PMI_526]
MLRLNWDIEHQNLCREWRAQHKRQVLPYDVFHIIAGSGTGGLIAGLLSSMQMTPQSAMDEYLRIAPALFPPLSSSNGTFLTKSGATQNLEVALQGVIKKHHPTKKSHHASLIEKSIHDSGHGLILAHESHNLRKLPALFRTYPIRGGQIECKLWEAFRATTADLGMGALQDVVINGRRYFGTSTGDGNPTEHLTREIDHLHPHARVDLFLSLGAGFPATIRLPSGTSTDLVNTLRALAKDCEETQEKMMSHWTSLYNGVGYFSPYHRLNVKQGIQGMEGKVYTIDISSEVIVHAEQMISEILVKKQIDEIGKTAHIFPYLPPPALPPGEQKRILALDSGGLLGISELLLLRTILGEDKRPFDYFHLIGGSGTGGIIAILLGRFQMTVKQAEIMFYELIKPVAEFIQKDQQRALNVQDLTNVFTNTLTKRLAALSNGQTPMMFPPNASEDDCKTFVLCNSTHNMDAKWPRFFGTYGSRQSMCRTNASVLEVMRATTAGRDLFTDARVGQKPTWELFGGADCANNNPAYHTIEEAKRLWPNSPPPYVISLGAGQVGTISLPASSTKRAQAFYKVLKKICADCELVHESLTRTQHPSHYHRFNVEHGLEDMNLWSLMARDSVTTTTINYTCRGHIRPEVMAVGEELERAFQLMDQVPQRRPGLHS